MGEFQALGGMHGHHHHGIIALVVLFQIRIQGDFLQKACKSGNLCIIHIGLNAGFQLADIFQPGFVFLCGLGKEHIGISGSLQHGIVKIRQAHAVFQQLIQLFHHGRELHQLHGRFFQRAIRIGIGKDAVQRLSLCICQPLGCFNGLCSQPTGRIVDNPFQPEIIGTVVDDTQVAEHILDFRPVEEAGASDDTVGDSVALQGKFHGVGLGVCPVQNGVVPKTLPPGQTNDLPGNIVALASFIAGFVHGDGVSCGIGCPELLALSTKVVGYYGVGCIQNRLCGTIILFQTNHAASFVLAFKVENVLNGCPPEAIDTLVVIAHHADILISPCQQRGQQILGVVGVLILIHQNIAEFPLIVAAHILMLCQKADGDVDDIVKIQSVVFLQPGLVLHIGLSNMQRPEVAGLLCPFQHLLGRNHFVLLLTDGAEDILGREGLVIQSHVSDDLLHDAGRIIGIIDGKAPGKAHTLDIPSENPAAGGVKGHGPDVFRLTPQKIGQTLLHFICCLIGEGNGQNAPRDCRFHSTQRVCPVLLKIIRFRRERFQEGDVIFRNGVGDFIGIAAPAEPHQIGDPIDENGGFAASGTCQKEKRPFRGQNGFLLHGVQLPELTGDILPSCGEESRIKGICHSCTCFPKDASILPHFRQKVKCQIYSISSLS